MLQYKFNLEKSPTDARDFMLESIYPVEVDLPEVWDMRSGLPSIRDQGSQGSCLAQTVAAMKEWQEKIDVGFVEHMSPQFVYNIRPNQYSEGMNPRDGLNILNKIGIVAERDFPYGTMSKPSEQLMQKASMYRIVGYAQVNTIDSLKKALYANGPCAFAFPVYDCNSMEFWKQQFPTQTMVGGHGVACVGWLKDSFIIRNSWSTGWGDRGYTYFKFADWGIQWEIWTAIDADSHVQGLLKKIDERKSREERKWLFRNIFHKKLKK